MPHALHKAGSPYYVKHVDDDYRDLFGPLLVDYWTTEQNRGVTLGSGTFASGAIQSWASQVLGIPVPAALAATRPVYATSSVFVGVSSVATSLAGAKSLYTPADVSALALSGSRPFVFSVFARQSITIPGSQAIFCLNGANDLPRMEIRDVSPGNVTFQGRVNNATAATVSSSDLLPHTIGTWCDGTNVNARLDLAAPVVTATAATIDANCVRVSIGGLGGAFGQQSNAEHVFHLVASAYPGAATEAALIALVHARFGF